MPEVMAGSLVVVGYDYTVVDQLIRHGGSGLLAR